MCKDYNDTYETDTNERKEIIKQLLPNSSQNIYL
ncbi:MAG: maltose acetyltransferase domain-containing protein [Ruminococcus bromii]|nr:maltose acetyltransferase domain-containing protein [Ruminococcus bromii]